MNKSKLIEDLRTTIPKIKSIVEKRKKEFKENFETNESTFKELCFCLLTANFNAYKSIIMQKEINDGFLTYSQQKLEEELSRLGHRFPKARAQYIVEARKYAKNIKDILEKFDSGKNAREWVVGNIKGLGYKEGSHFLRNVGFLDVAIIDYHIIDLLERYEIIKRPKTLTKNKYLEIEKTLEEIGKTTNLSLGELDLYLWYMETGKVLK